MSLVRVYIWLLNKTLLFEEEWNHYLISPAHHIHPDISLYFSGYAIRVATINAFQKWGRANNLSGNAALNSETKQVSASSSETPSANQYAALAGPPTTKYPTRHPASGELSWEICKFIALNIKQERAAVWSISLLLDVTNVLIIFHRYWNLFCRSNVKPSKCSCTGSPLQPIVLCSEFIC